MQWTVTSLVPSVTVRSPLFFPQCMLPPKSYIFLSLIVIYFSMMPLACGISSRAVSSSHVLQGHVIASAVMSIVTNISSCFHIVHADINVMLAPSICILRNFMCFYCAVVCDLEAYSSSYQVGSSYVRRHWTLTAFQGGFDYWKHQCSTLEFRQHCTSFELISIVIPLSE